MQQYLSLFLSFFKIGLFTFGGGYAMIPLIEEDLVKKRRWLKQEEFIDLFAMAQSLPGIFGVNISIFIGYRLKGNLGAVVAALGCILPSFIIILCIAIFFEAFKHNRVVAAMFKGLRPAVVALIAGPVITTWRTLKMKASALWIPALTALLVWGFGVSPVWIIIIAGCSGIAYRYFIEYRIRRMKSN